MPRKPVISPEMPYIAEPLRGLAVPIDSIRPDPRNARVHDERNLAAIEASLRKYGQLIPLVVNRQTRIISAGNGRWQVACARLGWKYIAVVDADHDETEQVGFAIADNRTAELAAWDEHFKDLLLAEIATHDADLYTALMLDDLLQPSLAPAATAAAEPVEKPSDKQNTYQVLVECSDPQDRQRFMRALRKQGRRCRAITWDGVLKNPGEAAENPANP